jgi:uncharacterized protein (DUF2336 family)
MFERKNSMQQEYKELTLNLLNYSPRAGHLFIRLCDKHKLYTLSKSYDPKVRFELANIITELLQLNINTSKNKLIEDVLLGLLKQAETDLKRVLSERLASLDKIPTKVIEYLADDEIIVADPVLRHSNILQEEKLISIIQEKDHLHWQAIAERSNLPDKVIDKLADTKDEKTAVSLTKNNNIELTKHAMSVFSVMAKSSDKLVKPLLKRPEFPRKLEKELYRESGEVLKEDIQKNLPYREATIATNIIDDIVFEVVQETEEKISPTAKMIKDAENMHMRGFLTIDVMIQNLRCNQFMNFVSMFSVYCALPIATVTQILCQESGQGLAVICKAMDFQKSEFVNIFLLTSSLRGQRIIGNDQLAKALRYYDKVTPHMAKQILNESRH